MTRFTPNTTYRSPGAPSLFSLVKFKSLYAPGDPYEMRVGPIGAVFDMVANVLINVAFLISIPIFCAAFLLAGAFILIKTALDIGNPSKQRALKNAVTDREKKRDNHHIFLALRPLTQLSQVSKRYRQVVQESLEPNKKIQTKAPIQQDETPDVNAQFRFFSAPELPSALRDQIIQFSVDEAMEKVYPSF